MNDAERLEQKKLKSTEQLTKAVLDLNKRFKQNEAIAKKSGLIGDQGIIKTLFSEQKNKLKSIFSLKGAASMMGFGPDTILGKVLDMRHEKKEAQKAEAQSALKYAQNFTKYDPRGQELAKSGEKNAIKEGVKLYKERLEVLEKISAIEREISEAKEHGQGDIVAAAHKNEMDSLTARRDEIESGARPSKPEPTTSVAPPSESKKEVLDDLVEALLSKGNVLEQAKEELLKTTGAERISGRDEETLNKGIRSGMRDELVKLNEEQLEMLKKLVKNSEPSMEDKLESKIGKKPEEGKTTIIEKAKGGLGSLFSTLMSGFGGIMDMLKMTPLGKLAGGAWSVAKGIGRGAMALGRGALSLGKGAWNLGKSAIGGAAKLGSSVLSSLPILGSASKIEGVVAKEGAEAATKAVAKGGAEAATKVVAKEGTEVAAKAAGKAVAKEGAEVATKAGAKSLGKSVLKKIPGIGLLAGIGFGLSRMSDGDYLGAAGEVASGLASTIPGIGTAASIGIDAALAGRDIMNEVSKTETTSREQAGLEMDENKAETERLSRLAKQKADEAKAPPATIINNNVVNNNGKTVKLNMPPVRNIEPSYNHRLFASVSTIGIRG